MMNILCKLFGHKPPIYGASGWWSPGEQYGGMTGGNIDGIGRVHVNLHARCARCDQRFNVMRAHVSEDVANSVVQSRAHRRYSDVMKELEDLQSKIYDEDSGDGFQRADTRQVRRVYDTIVYTLQKPSKLL